MGFGVEVFEAFEGEDAALGAEEVEGVGEVDLLAEFGDEVDDVFALFGA